MADDSASRYFDFYRANLNGEKKSTDRFLGSNLQCCLHATVLPAVKYLEELNNGFRGHANFPPRSGHSGNLSLLSTGIFHK
jgi:hypothetical protein